MTHTFTPGSATLPSFRHRCCRGAEGEDARWKELTVQANAIYARGDTPRAHALYQDALAEAERLFDAALERPGLFPAPVIYNVSCHNLAELEARNGNDRGAEAFYRKACDRLQSAANAPVTLLPMRIACVQHLKPALAALFRHLHRQGTCADEFEDVFHQACKTIFRVSHVVECAERMGGDTPPHVPIVLS